MNRTDAIEAFLARAARDVYDKAAGTGVWESAGENRSPAIDKMNELCNVPLGSPWCAAFMATCGHDVLAAAWPAPLTASCDILLAWGRNRKVLHTKAQRGDLFLILNASDADDAVHTGAVTDADDSGVKTIEGNSNQDGSREGWECTRHARTYGPHIVFVRWADLIDGDPSSEAWKVVLGGNTLPAQLIGGSAFVGLRAMTQALFGEQTDSLLGWSENDSATFSGNPIPSAVPLRIIDGTTFVGVRAFAAWMGLTISVDASADTIKVFRAS